MGEGFFLMAKGYFAGQDALKAAMKSSELATAGENLNSFAEGVGEIDVHGRMVSERNRAPQPDTSP